MKTKKLSTYRQFIKAGRPYIPTPDNEGRLLLPNFSTCQNSTAVKHARRLVITSGTIYNYSGFVVVWSVSMSRYGLRVRWQYWLNGQRVTWPSLSWYEKHTVARAYYKHRESLPIVYAPSKNIGLYR